jgi:hypothetical protein
MTPGPPSVLGARCPSCGQPLRLRRLLGRDLRHVECEHCPAIVSVKSHLGLLPAMLLIFLGPPMAKAVDEGWLGLWTAIVVGLVVLPLGAVIGHRVSRTTLVRHRHERTST